MEMNEADLILHNYVAAYPRCQNAFIGGDLQTSVQQREKLELCSEKQ